MSQPSGSMIANILPNSELKYQKALKQISKLIQTNKILKNECEDRQKKLGQDLTSIAIKYEQLSKKYEQLMEQKQRMQQYIDEQQDTHQGLSKQYQTMERQVKYLNDVLIEQNGQLKKLSAFKDEKGVSELFRSYEQKQTNYKKDILRFEDHICTLQKTIDTLEEDVIEEKEMRQRYQDQFNILGLEIVKYRDLNNYLMNQNEAIINSTQSKNKFYNKNKQVQTFLVQFKNQLEHLHHIQFLNQDIPEKQYIKNYQILLQQKNNISLQLAKIKDQLEISQTKVKQTYQMQQKMTNCIIKLQIITQQNNMLKNRITLLESKDILDEIGIDEENEFKDFQDKINFLMTKSDPLETIKNGQNNSHFLMMKTFIMELHKKLEQALFLKETYQTKYKKLKSKFNKKAEENIIYEQSNKIMKGKLQGYERLTQKLHYELEKSIGAHEDEIIKMVAITNNLVSKKVEQSKSASVFIKNQFDIQIQKAERTQKSLSQQLQTFKLQSSSQRIIISDLEQRLSQSTQLMQIYQKKLNENNIRYKQLQQQNNSLQENLMKFQQLYHEQKIRHETILIQKQNLSNKVNLLAEQITGRTYKFEEVTREKDQAYNTEIRKLRNQNNRLHGQFSGIKEQNIKLFTQLEQKRRRQTTSFSNLMNDNGYYTDLEHNYQELKCKNKLIQEELIAIRNKTSNIDALVNSIADLENQFMRKTDELNDEKRSIILLKRQIQNLQLNNNELTEQNKKINEELESQRAKIYSRDLSVTKDSTSSNYNSKQLQSRRTIQRLNEQITILQSLVRDERRNNSIISGQIQNYKSTIDGLNQIITRCKNREQSLISKLSEAEDQITILKDQLETYKIKNSHNSNNILILNNQIAQITQKTHNLSEQLNNLKGKLAESQRKYQKISREIAGLKHYIGQADKMVRRLSSIQRLEWEQQRDKQNIASLISQLNNIIKGSESQITSSGSGEYKFIPSSSFGNIENNLQKTFLKYSGNRSPSSGIYDNSLNFNSNNSFNVV